jgi:hypothetical protein
MSSLVNFQSGSYEWLYWFRSWQAIGILFYWTVLLNLIAK